jgi:hypothetical protein
VNEELAGDDVSRRHEVSTNPNDPAIPEGTYQFVMAAVEPNATDMLLVSRTAVMCPH